MIALRTVSASLVFALLAWPLRLPAAIVDFEMGGVISDTTTLTHSPIAGISVGDSWRVRTRFEGEPAEAVLGRTSNFALLYYELSIASALALKIEPYEIRFDRQTILLSVGRNSTSGNFLQFRASNAYYFGDVAWGALPISPEFLFDGRILWQTGVVMNHPSMDLWLLNAFSNSLEFELDDFDENRFFIVFRDERTYPRIFFDDIVGTVDFYDATIVPVPATASLMAAALLAAGGATRRRRRPACREAPAEARRAGAGAGPGPAIAGPGC